MLMTLRLALSDCVVVTGATGFIASHVIEQLFQRGYVVHGTVRDPSNEKKIAFLRELEKKYEARLILFKADLLEPNPFDRAVEGCSGFFHIASPVMDAHVDKQRTVDAAIQGTLSALNAAQKGKVKTMIITSSVASMSMSKAKMNIKLEDCRYPYNVSDWNDVSTIDRGTYSYSKVQAELATNEWMSKFETPPFRLATVHFAIAFGPQLSTRVTSSNTIIHTTLLRESPFILPFYFHVVDVRDVARAHIHLFENQKAQGRFIVAIDQYLSAKSWLDVSNDILEADDMSLLPISTLVMPLWLLSLLVWLQVDERLSKDVLWSARFGFSCGYDGSKITDELGFEYIYTDMKTTIQDAARSMLRLGLVNEETPSNGISNGFLIALVVSALVLSFILYCCCCRRRKDKND